MSGGDGRGPGNSGLGHNGGQASGNVNGTWGLTLNGTVSHVKDFLSDKSEYCGQ